MGVYIKGMETPTRCEKCRCCKPYEKGIYCTLTVTPVLGNGNARLNNCPLVPVPPHGRLGDLDELLVEINTICDRRDAGIISDLTCLQQLLSAIRHAPTVIEAEEGE